MVGKSKEVSSRTFMLILLLQTYSFNLLSRDSGKLFPDPCGHFQSHT
ncbi:hypothetical protein GACE_1110 [Geoglobus acetivorans]|uniref:Uncharacterized protein n=1 Tax=Geoglobus acetivorans TaxID=565033 RepID=A0A0A7GDQ4_GEOAI|nr:hypothetical protein GACE_1110 [Geoglobus acetivorans]